MQRSFPEELQSITSPTDPVAFNLPELLVILSLRAGLQNNSWNTSNSPALTGTNVKTRGSKSILRADDSYLGDSP